MEQLQWFRRQLPCPTCADTILWPVMLLPHAWLPVITTPESHNYQQLAQERKEAVRVCCKTPVLSRSKALLTIICTGHHVPPESQSTWNTSYARNLTLLDALLCFSQLE